MRYAFHDLGHQTAGTEVTVDLAGSVCNVLLLDPENYAHYRARRPFAYVGGHYARSPVRLQVPEDGRWCVVVDLGGFKGRVRASVAVETASEAAGKTAGEVEMEELVVAESAAG